MRLFVALFPPDEARDALEDWQEGLAGADWTHGDDLHLTLRFIGEVDSGTADDIHVALQAIEAPSFELHVRGLGRFATRDRPRALYAAVPRNDALEHLHAKVERAVVQAGQQPEPRRFTPHVTLARLRDVPIAAVDRFVAAHGDAQIAPFTVDEFALVESTLGKGGAVYRTLATYKLR